MKFLVNHASLTCNTTKLWKCKHKKSFKAQLKWQIKLLKSCNEDCSKKSYELMNFWFDLELLLNFLFDTSTLFVGNRVVGWTLLLHRLWNHGAKHFLLVSYQTFDFPQTLACSTSCFQFNLELNISVDIFLIL